MRILLVVSALIAVSLAAKHTRLQQFNEFKAKFQKQYANTGEELNRLRIFSANVEDIERHNAQGSSYTKGINAFTDLTAEEFKETFLGTKSIPSSKNLPRHVSNRDLTKEPFTEERFAAIDACARVVLVCAPGSLVGVKQEHGQGAGGGACPECGEEFAQRPLLLAHIQAQHKKEAKLRCFICGLTFNKKHNLVVHLNSWHPNEKFPYCRVCMEIFNDTKSMDSHECPGAEIRSREVICHLHEEPLR